MLSRQLAGPLTLVLSLCLTSGWPKAATAAEGKSDDSANPAEKVQKLNRYAMQLFDDQNFALAEKSLLEALAILEKGNLAIAPASLSTHGNLAILYSLGLKNPDRAVAEFKKALAIKPDLKMNKQRSTPETEANLARARAEMGGGPAPAKAVAPSRETAPEPKRGEAAAAGGLRCPGGGEIQAGDDVDLKCVTSDAHVADVTLYYKANGAEDYRTLAMTKGESSGGTTTWGAKIPGSDTNAKWVPMYFEAHNRAGAAIAHSGRADSPNVITVLGAGAGGTGSGPRADSEDDEDAEVEEIDDNNPLARLENERRRESEGIKGTWMFSASIGSGVGYAVGKTPEAFHGQGARVTPGIAPAYLGHAALEVGYFISRHTALSVQTRNQWMPGMKYGAARGAHSVLLRVMFVSEAGWTRRSPSENADEGDPQLAKEQRSRIRWYFALAEGGGEGFRLRVPAGVRDSEGNPTNITVSDTVRGGPFVSGIGGGMVVKLWRRWHWTIDAQVLFGYPQFSVVHDLTTGIRWMH
jgi:hypothetical protein